MITKFSFFDILIQQIKRNQSKNHLFDGSCHGNYPDIKMIINVNNVDIP